MKFYYCPGSCSLGIHVLLAESGAKFELSFVDLFKGEQQAPSFLSFNPKGKVPALLLDDGTTLTEYPAVAYYIATQYPQAQLLPSDLLKTTQALSLTCFITDTLHSGALRMFRPIKFTTNEQDHETVRKMGAEIMRKGLDIVSNNLGTQDYCLGTFSIADSALFYICYGVVNRFADLVSLPSNIKNHYNRMIERPAVRKVLETEKLSLVVAA